MKKNEIAEVLILIGKRMQSDPDFINILYQFLEEKSSKNVILNDSKATIEKIDFYEMIKNNNISEIQNVLEQFNTRELKHIIKKYRFSVPINLKTEKYLREYIIKQLTQRTTDVFMDNSNKIDDFKS